jgi:hypothetical protein
MNRTQSAALRALQRTVFLAGIAGVAFADTIPASFEPAPITRPAAPEFGTGPRASAKHLYTATLQAAGPFAKRRLLNVPVLIVDAKGRPVEGARISVDGGMPEHAHGLPTKPLVRRELGGGMYEIEGLRFSMGGWWEIDLAIESPAGSDRVTFNLEL